ncbi:hypothetical protein HYS29_00095 [Candidatus Microgenomates bacterium]|nr:hypothetical protein [Candidatus Microgenomates bacterium]MBI2622068.1 hypothetical protein [Candidatus Microgenomates bacterium]
MGGDPGSEILKRAFGEKSAPFTEQQRQTAKRAAMFAVLTFNPDIALGERILTPEQIAFAKNFREVYPKPNDVLPKSEFNSAYAGYSRLVSTPMFELIPALIEDENTTFGGSRDFQVAPEKFRDDPTGVSYIKYMLQEIEEEASIGQVELEGKGDEVRTKIAAILYASRDIPDKPPEPKPLDDRTVADDILAALMKALGGNQTQREAFLSRARSVLHNEIPMEIGEDGEILSSAALRVLGARLAFEQYQLAVNIYMNRWGNNI